MSVKSMPEGYHTVTPLMSVKGAARLIEFMKKAFGAVEVYRFAAPDGSVMHAEMKIGDSVMMLGEAMHGAPAMPAAFYLYVQDADTTYRTALDAGGESVEKPDNKFWGDRVGTVKDFAGNRWWIATHVEDVSSEELEKRARQTMAA
jgi:uncharacterized glyoxalase superfamily protein PhnB